MYESSFVKTKAMIWLRLSHCKQTHAHDTLTAWVIEAKQEF